MGQDGHGDISSLSDASCLLLQAHQGENDNVTAHIPHKCATPACAFAGMCGRRLALSTDV